MGRLLKTDARIPPNRETPYLFSGIARCASCKNTLSRRTVGKYKYYCCSLAKSIKGSCAGCQIPVETFDTRVQQMIGEHIDDVMSLLKRIAAGNLEDKLQKQITRLRDEAQAVEAEIDKQRFLIRKLAPTMAEGLLTKKEANELCARFEEEKDNLEQRQSGILGQIRQIEDGTLLECHWAKHFKPYFGQTSFSRKDIAMLIEAIFLYKDKHIEIRFVYDSEFQYIRQVLE